MLNISVGSNPRRQTSTTQEYRSWPHGMTNVSISEVNMFRNSSTLAVSDPINLSIKLGFVSVNGPRETYFVYALLSFECKTGSHCAVHYVIISMFILTSPYFSHIH